MKLIWSEKSWDDYLYWQGARVWCGKIQRRLSQGVRMYAIEFEADVRNQSIQIPTEYADLESKHLRVIVMDISPQKSELPEGFHKPVKIDSYASIAKRDEIYER